MKLARFCTLFVTLLLHNAMAFNVKGVIGAGAGPTMSHSRHPLHTFAPSQRMTSRLYQVASSTSEGDQTEAWTKPRLHNSAAFRTMTLLTALLWAGFSLPKGLVPAQVMGSIHLLSFGTWFGSVAYTTFVAGITMFKNLPRQVFGRLQAKLFPKYFSLGSLTLVLQLISLKSLKAMTKVSAHTSAKSLALALLMTLVNQFYLEPQSTANMLERYQLESDGRQETERYQTLKANFGKFHGMSSLTNLIALGAGVAHASFIAAALVTP